MQISSASTTTAAQLYTTTSGVRRSPGPTGLEGLTDADRAFIAATTGTVLTPDATGGPAIAFDIAADRRAGLLVGAIDRTYLDGVLSRAQQSYAEQARETRDDAVAAADAARTARDYYQRWWDTAQRYLNSLTTGSDSSSLDGRPTLDVNL